MICQYSWCYQVSMAIMVDYKIASSCIDYDYVTDYKIYHFVLEQIDLHVFLPVIYQQQLLLCVNKCLKTSIIKY